MTFKKRQNFGEKNQFSSHQELRVGRKIYCMKVLSGITGIFYILIAVLVNSINLSESIIGLNTQKGCFYCI